MNYRLIPQCLLFFLISFTGCSKKKNAQKALTIPQPSRTEQNSKVLFSDFVGSKQCQSCHKDIFSQWKKSTHGKAGGYPNEVNIIAPFNGDPIILADVIIYPEKNDNNYQFRIINKKTKNEQKINVEAVVGGGFMAGGGTQTFFGKYEDGTYRFLPFDFSRDENSWFVQVKGSEEWELVNNEIRLNQLYNWPPHRVLGEIDDISNCQNCHGSQIISEKVGNNYNMRFTSLAINCESCHGPAKKHVTIMSEIVRGVIKNSESIGINSLVGISPRESLNLCFQCHAVKTPLKNGYLPGEDLEEYYSLRLALLGNQNPYSVDGRIKSFGYQQNHIFSDCFINGSMTCTSCHNPHTQDYQDINKKTLVDRFDDQQCTACHAAIGKNPPAHTFHKVNSQGSKCVSCHMPFRQEGGIGNQIKFTRSDHTIAIPRPVYDKSQGFESSCIQCHSDQTEEELQVSTNQLWGSIKPMNAVIENRLKINNETSERDAINLLLQPQLKHSIGQFANLSYFIKRYLSPGMEFNNPEIVEKLKAYSEIDDDIDLKALALAGLHYSQYKNPKVRNYLLGQLDKIEREEHSVRLRWGLILDYFGTVFYMIGDRPRAIECYELARQVLPDDKKIKENLARAKS
jgi:hypothetical protein